MGGSLEHRGPMLRPAPPTLNWVEIDDGGFPALLIFRGLSSHKGM